MDARPGKSAKKVVFHIGFPKTGSSAIQTFLSANAGALEEAGVHYPYPEPRSVVATGNCTGNLVQVLYRDGFVEAYQRQVGGKTRLSKVISKKYFERIKKIIDDSTLDTVVFSSEVFSIANEESLSYFRKEIFENYDVVLIAFVRDFFDYFFSSWRQSVKTQKTSQTFSEFFYDRTDGRMPTTSGFTMLRSLNLRPLLLNYDTYKTDIVGKFLEVAGLPPLSAIKYDPLSGEDYNVSLTAAEAALVQLANKRFPSGDFPATLTKRLLRRPAAERPGGKYYSASIDNAMFSEYGPLIREMNECITGEPLRTAPRSQADSEAAIGNGEIACLLETMALAMQESARGESRLSAYDWAKGVLWRRSEGIPPDFDAKAYLFHNADVANAGVDPKLHYLAHGKVEQRRYRFF